MQKRRKLLTINKMPKKFHTQYAVTYIHIYVIETADCYSVRVNLSSSQNFDIHPYIFVLNLWFKIQSGSTTFNVVRSTVLRLRTMVNLILEQNPRVWFFSCRVSDILHKLIKINVQKQISRTRGIQYVWLYWGWTYFHLHSTWLSSVDSSDC